ncbi:MAG TPA: hypothetical protein VHC22_05600 [Pirellulales bacterium]|nr:hypothetical protein [Pirellulales bacterium]
MATHYLLPCTCGQKNEVDSSQAGLTVNCACGSKLTVPAMRGLAGLERVERAPPPHLAAPTNNWGPRQGLMFLGGTVITAAALLALYFWLQLPEPITLLPDYEAINRQSVDQLTPEQSIERWHELQVGIQRPSDEMQLDFLDRYTASLMQWIMLGGGVGAVGLLLFVIGLCMPSKRRATSTPTAPARAA